MQNAILALIRLPVCFALVCAAGCCMEQAKVPARPAVSVSRPADSPTTRPLAPADVYQRREVIEERHEGDPAIVVQ